MPVELVGVPFSSTGRRDGIAAAIAVLRSCHLAERLADRGPLRDAGDLVFADQTPARSPGRLRNESGVISLVVRTRSAVRSALARGNLPLLVGGDCPVVLGALAGLRDHAGAAGLVMVDGHQDAYPPARSPTGEASDSELGIALGLFDPALPAELVELTPLLSADRVALIGARDAQALVRDRVASLAGRVWLRTDRDVRRRGAQATAREAARVGGRPGASWWLHVDFDVLRTADFPAADYPQDGGLTWNELELAVGTLLCDPGCAGASAVIYNADLDPHRNSARRIVELLAWAVGCADRAAGPVRG